MRACFLSHLDAACASSCHRAISARKNWRRNLTGISSVFASETRFATPFRGTSHIKQRNSTSRSSSTISNDLLESSRSSIRSSIQLKPMAAAKSQLLSRDFIVGYGLPGCEGSLQNGGPSAVLFHDTSRVRRCQRVGMTLRCYYPSRGYLSYGLAMKDVPTGPISSLSYSRCHSNGVAPDISLTDDQLGYSADSAQPKRADQGSFKLVSGVSYLPHPDKEKTGGEDAHFICEDYGIIGVADGVGGWAAYGIDAGEYSRGLMSNAVSFIKEESSGGFIDPARILEKAHAVTRFTGSCTACIIALTDQGIHAINLGDSGFVVIRDGSTIFRSRAQQYEFNFPYQLGSDTACEPPSSGEILKCSVLPGDVIVAGTDGLFDNVYNNEINSLVVHAKRVHLKPEEMAKNIAALARERAVDRNRETPFSASAREAGFRYYGGKLDDITVVVSYVTSTSSE